MSQYMQYHPNSVDVSVIVPFFNAAKYLALTLESISQQTHRSFEVILVDDGSFDKSSKMAEAKAVEDVRFKYVRQKNAGAGAARNMGMSLARGRWLLFLDADDLVEPVYIEKMVRAAEKTNVSVVVCRADSFESSTNRALGYYGPTMWRLPAGVVLNSEYSGTLFQSFTYVPWDKLFRTKFLKEHALEFQNLTYSNDNYFVLSALIEAESVYVLDDVLIHHRIGAGGSLRDNMARDRSMY